MSSKEEVQSKSRRELLKKGMMVTGSAMLLAATGMTGYGYAEAYESNKERLTLQPLPHNLPQDDNILRMYRDLRRALAKPEAKRRWGMIIDRRRCVGCKACNVACKAENGTPPGVDYRPVSDEETGAFPRVQRQYLPQPCMQCAKPPCTEVCPVGATYKRNDGITVIDYEKCVGCKSCIAACPYGARGFDQGTYYTENTPQIQIYELQPVFEYDKSRVREQGKPPVGKARKCHFCLHRIKRGMLPACVTTCIGRATYFGDGTQVKACSME